MARPRVGVTTENINSILHFFTDAINDSRRTVLIDEDLRNQAKTQLKRLKEGNAPALDRWVLKYISQKGWQQCLNKG